MNSANLRYNTYPVIRPSASHRLSSSLSSNWITVRETRGDVSSETGGRATEDKPDCPSETEDTKTKSICEPDVLMAVAMEEAESNETDEVFAPEIVIAKKKQDEASSANTVGLSAYGCVYQKGSQRLVVMHPGDTAPVHFTTHSCLKNINHTEGEDFVELAVAGDYEISFDVRLSAKTSAPVVFELRADNEPVPGGVFVFTLSSGFRECRGGTMAYLKAGSCIGLVLSSVSVCEASLAAGGVSAMLCLKKLN